MSTEPSVLLVMGVTGSGKSTFINLLAGEEIAKTSNSLLSCTSRVQGQQAVVGGTRVLLIDTPGFDDTFRSDAEILEEICNALCAQHAMPWKLKGVIFLHNISNNRFGGGSMKTLSMFLKICGTEALKNVILVTTHWDKIDVNEGAFREKELRDRIWTHMLRNHATMARSYGDEGSAIGIASQLLNKDNVVLEIQKELSEGKQLKETSAGAVVNETVEHLRIQYQKELRDLEETRDMLIQQDAAMRAQIKKEWQEEKAKLHQMQQQAAIMNHAPATQVGDAVTKAKKKHNWVKFLPMMIGPVIDVLGMFIGFPLPGAGTALTS